MRTVAVAFLFCLTSSIANAQSFQSNKPVVCDNAQKVIRALGENYEEKPIWAGSGESTKFSLFINKTTGSWTIIQFTTEIACILGVGQDSKIILGDQI